MGAIVQFNYQTWQQRYPELANVPSGQALGYFDLATTFQRNDGGGPINDQNVQLNGLNLLVAHIAVLSGWVPNKTGGIFDGSNARVVGHVDSATEGSVSVQATVNTGATSTPLQVWASQTSYGWTWYSMTQFVRQFRYVARRPYRPTPWPFG